VQDTPVRVSRSVGSVFHVGTSDQLWPFQCSAAVKVGEPRVTGVEVVPTASQFDAVTQVTPRRTVLVSPGTLGAD
jgi:hypothetical protein